MDFQTEIQDSQVSDIIEATQFCGYDIKQTNEDQQMSIQDNNKVSLSDNKITATLQPLSWNMFRVKIAE